MKSFLNTAIAAIKALAFSIFAPSVSALIVCIVKLENMLEQKINAEVLKLNRLSVAASALNARIVAKNADIDAAYKLLHKVSQITK